jgi:hypothetical protein
LKVFDVTSGDVIKEFNKGSKAITSLAYVSISFLIKLGLKWITLRKWHS